MERSGDVLLPEYAKTVVAVVAAAALTAQNVLTDNTVTPAEWVEIAAAALTAYGVYRIPNRPPDPPGEHARPE